MTAQLARKRNEVEQEIRETLGLIPSLFNRIPDAALDQEWQLFKHHELDRPALAWITPTPVSKG